MERIVSAYLDLAMERCRHQPLTGAPRSKKWQKKGGDLNGNGYPYPYVLLTKDGTDLEDEKSTPL